MKNECYDVESRETDTAGKPKMYRVCYCGTTACMRLPKNDYPLPRDFTHEISPEEEERFYKKVFKKENK